MEIGFVRVTTFGSRTGAATVVALAVGVSVYLGIFRGVGVALDTDVERGGRVSGKSSCL
jgi:hypothetical protein